MVCTADGVPEYLHWNKRQVYKDADFLNDQLLYRLTNSGNPIEFPQGTYTALSCKWSFLIEEKDVVTAERDFIADSYKYAVIGVIRNYSLKRQKEFDGENSWHKLTCEFNHDPKVCDYSHSEILIKHDIYRDEAESQLITSFLYTYHIWQNDKPVLKRKSYKEICKDYRRDMISIFCHP